MVLSKSSHYALRAALFISQQPGPGYVPINKITGQLDLSFHFITKILQRLTQAGLLYSVTGPRGGVKLAKPANKICLREIVEAVEGAGLFTCRLLGSSGCSDEQPCPAHQQWLPMRDRLTRLFEKTTLAMLASKPANQALHLINME